MADRVNVNSPEQALFVSRVIAGALVAGVTIFGVVAWLMNTESGPARPDPALGATLFYVWLGWAFVSAVGSMLFWRARVSPFLESADRSGTGTTGAEPDPVARASAMMSGMVVSWALIEGAALFGVVVYFLFGSGLAGTLGVLMMWAAAIVTWPKREWFTNR